MNTKRKVFILKDSFQAVADELRKNRDYPLLIPAYHDQFELRVIL
jgi:hypothetical protein